MLRQGQDRRYCRNVCSVQAPYNLANPAFIGTRFNKTSGHQERARKPGRFSLLLGNAVLSQKFTYRRWPRGGGIETRYDRYACGKAHMPG